jgi:hypothetical protein
MSWTPAQHQHIREDLARAIAAIIRDAGVHPAEWRETTMDIVTLTAQELIRQHPSATVADIAAIFTADHGEGPIGTAILAELDPAAAFELLDARKVALTALVQALEPVPQAHRQLAARAAVDGIAAHSERHGATEAQRRALTDGLVGDALVELSLTETRPANGS